MAMAMYDYDLVVIGSGPAGEKGAVQAAYFGKTRRRHRALAGARRRLRQHRHAAVEDAARDRALPLRLPPARDVRPLASQLSGAPSVPELMCRQEPVLGHEGGRIRANLERHSVDLLDGSARFSTSTRSRSRPTTARRAA